MEVSVGKLMFLGSILTLLLFISYSVLNNFHSEIPVQVKSEPSLIEPVSVSEIKPGDILLMRGNTLVDKVIKWVTRSPYSHVVGVINTTQVVEVSPLSTVRYKSLQKYLGEGDVFTCDRLSAEDRKKIVDYVKEKIGTSYDYNLVIWEASRYLFNRIWPYENKNSSLCSTLWSDAYHEAGIDLCPEVKFPVPGDLAKSRYLHRIRSLVKLSRPANSGFLIKRTPVKRVNNN